MRLDDEWIDAWRLCVYSDMDEAMLSDEPLGQLVAGDVPRRDPSPHQLYAQDLWMELSPQRITSKRLLVAAPGLDTLGAIAFRAAELQIECGS
jgi:hypothetical protein